MNTISLLEPKPCPFCGADARLEYVTQLRPAVNLIARQVVRCTNCQAQTRERWSAAEALALWNRRDPATAEVRPPEGV